MGCCINTDKKTKTDGESSKPIKVESVTFYRSDANGAPSEPVDGVFFTTDNKIHARCVLSHVLVGSYGRVVWVCNDSRGVGMWLLALSRFLNYPPNYEIVACNLTSLLMNIIDTHAELPRPWPVGEYELRLFINDQLLHQAQFKIIEPPTN